MQETAIKLFQDKFPGLHDKFSEGILDLVDFRGAITLHIRPEVLRSLVAHLKQDPNLRFDVMMDLFGMDYELYDPPTPERFAVIYQFVSLFEKNRIFLKVFLSESNCTVDSIHDLFAAANWFEREAWDLYGIQFKGHPNLTRILCHNEFVGHPLRKDYQSDKYQPLRTVLPSSGL